MAYNGLGTFVRLYNWANDAAAGTKIRSDRMDAETDGIASGLSTAICKDGQTTTTAAIPFAAGLTATTGAFSSTLSGGGTTTNDSAAVGIIGEFKETILASGSALSLTTNTELNATSVSLTAGDWEVTGCAAFNGGATTTVTKLISSVSSTSAVLGTLGTTAQNRTVRAGDTPFASDVIALLCGPTRFSLAVTTTIYLVAFATFGVSTATVYGHIRARRVR